METEYINNLGIKTEIPRIKIKYVLYARKSTESDEKQALSIESQVKEMLVIAGRDGLEIVDIRRESHSAKDQGNGQFLRKFLKMWDEVDIQVYWLGRQIDFLEMLGILDPLSISWMKINW